MESDDLIRLRWLLGGSAVATLGTMGLLNWRLRQHLRDARKMPKKDLPGIYEHAGLGKKFPTFPVEDYANAAYASGDANTLEEVQELPSYQRQQKRDRGLPQRVASQGAVLYDPAFARPGVLAHEAGHARIEATPPRTGVGGLLDRLSSFNQRWLRPVSGVASMLAPAAALAASRFSGGPVPGALMGLGIGAVAGLPTLVNEFQASRHAFNYLNQAEHLSPAEKSKNKKALSTAYLTYLAGTLMAPTLTGAAGGWYHNSGPLPLSSSRPPGLAMAGPPESPLSQDLATKAACWRLGMVKRAGRWDWLGKGLGLIKRNPGKTTLLGGTALGLTGVGGTGIYYRKPIGDTYQGIQNLADPEHQQLLGQKLLLTQLEGVRDIPTADDEAAPPGPSGGPAPLDTRSPVRKELDEVRRQVRSVSQEINKRHVSPAITAIGTQAGTVGGRQAATTAESEVRGKMPGLMDEFRQHGLAALKDYHQQAGQAVTGQLSNPYVAAGLVGGGALLGGLAGGHRAGLKGNLRGAAQGGLTAGGGLLGAGLAGHLAPGTGLGGVLGGAALGALAGNLGSRFLPGDEEEDD